MLMIFQEAEMQRTTELTTRTAELATDVGEIKAEVGEMKATFTRVEVRLMPV